MQSTKNSLFRIPKLGKFLLLTSGLLVIGSGILLGNYAVKALNGGGNSPQDGEITFAGIKSQNLKKNFSKTHFTLKGNDFGGGFIWLPAKELDNRQVVTVNGKNYYCSTQVRGFYYNSQRGERLWPLDDQTRKELGYTEAIGGKKIVEGGRYTNCTPNNPNSTNPSTNPNNSNDPTDPYGIYGSITHVDGLGNRYVLNAGIAYDVNANRMQSPGAFQCNLQRLNNQFPFGYFFDNAGGIGLLGASVQNIDQAQDFHSDLLGQLNNKDCMIDIATYDGEKVNIPSIENVDQILDFGVGNALETIFKLGIRGVVGLSAQVQQEGKLGKDGNESGTSVLVRTDNSIANIFNLTKKNAEKLCKGKWGRDISQNIICSEGELSTDINSIGGKTLIVKEGNLELTSYLDKTNNNNAPTTIYLMKGDLVLPASAQTGMMLQFQGNGYLGSTNNTTYSKAAYLKGNFIINGLLQIKDNKKLENKLVVHGKIASLNTLEAPNKLQRDFLEAQVLKGKQKPVILSELFDWQCNAATGEGTDGTPCAGEGFIVDKAFSLIDMNFSSSLFQ